MSRAAAAVPAQVEELVDIDPAEEWERVLERRIEEVRTGQVETIPAEQVFAEIRGELDRRANERASRALGKSRR